MRMAPASAYSPGANERTDPVLGLEHDRPMTGALQLVGGYQPSQPTADDQHPLGPRRLPGQSTLQNGVDLGQHLGCLVGPWLPRWIAMLTHHVTIPFSRWQEPGVCVALTVR
jgi:hypothetical protein